jgi:hypothetical protein
VTLLELGSETFTCNVGEVETPLPPLAGELNVGGFGGEPEPPWGKGAALGLLKSAFLRMAGSAGLDAKEIPLGRMWSDLRCVALLYESALDIEARVGTSLAVRSFGIPRLFRSRDFEIGRWGTDSSGAGNRDIPVDTGAGLGPAPVTDFGAAVEVVLAPRSKA